MCRGLSDTDGDDPIWSWLDDVAEADDPGELERGELVELDLVAYPYTDWLVGVDLVWKKAEPMGAAAAWLKSRIERESIFEKADSR